MIDNKNTQEHCKGFNLDKVFPNVMIEMPLVGSVVSVGVAKFFVGKIKRECKDRRHSMATKYIFE